MPSLEASSFETQLSFGIAGDDGSWKAPSVVVSHGLVQVGELHGGCKARAVAFAPLVAVRGYLTLSVWLLVADRGGWRC